MIYHLQITILEPYPCAPQIPCTLAAAQNRRNSRQTKTLHIARQPANHVDVAELQLELAADNNQTMQDTHHLLSNNKSPLFPSHPFNSTTTKPHLLFSSPTATTHDFPPRFLHFPPLSCKTNTISLPPKPPKTPEIPSSVPSPYRHPHHFQEMILYLDSIGVDIVPLLDHHRPIILSASLHDVKSTVDLLASMDITAVDFRRIVSMCPEILASNSSSILPVFTFLLREARVNGSDLKRVIYRRPRLLVSSVKHRLRPTLYFLQSIGFEEVNKHTYLLSCSVEDKLIPRIEYFENIGFSYREAVLMFRKFPPLFNYSVKDNLDPKLNYFLVEMGRDLKELKEFPQYFSFSLENRIKPRHQCCVEKGVYFPLRVLLKTSEAQFRSRLEVCCNSSIPFRGSPLSTVNFDSDYNTE